MVVVFRDVAVACGFAVLISVAVRFEDTEFFVTVLLEGGLSMALYLVGLFLVGLFLNGLLSSFEVVLDCKLGLNFLAWGAP